jgi:hypothetical protein
MVHKIKNQAKGMAKIGFMSFQKDNFYCGSGLKKEV